MTTFNYFNTEAESSTLGNQLCQQAHALKFGDVHIRLDPETQLLAVIAVHSLVRGPAIGGCRLKSYPSIEVAIQDAMRLAQMMSYKSAFIDLPHGGAKAVIVEPNGHYDRTRLLGAYARFVDSLGGDYITAVDSGTSPSDMDTIATVTPHVLCTTSTTANLVGNASLYTAMGVLRGIEAAVQFTYQRDSLSGLHVVIQGAGEVGHFLAEKLVNRGARLTMADTNPDHLARCVKDFDVSTVSADLVYDVACDVFSPCALGGTLNTSTVARLNTPIVAGSANNQLENDQAAQDLQDRGILYVPDFVINSGGLIYSACAYRNADQSSVDQMVDRIYDHLLAVFEQADEKSCSPQSVVVAAAKDKLR